MAIANPCVISPIRRTDVILWFSEYGDTSKAPDEHTDPNEIVVVAKGSKIKPLHAIIVGRDDMAQCSSITFDKPAWQIRVWCQ
jgi:hypothetical protein